MGTHEKPIGHFCKYFMDNDTVFDEGDGRFEWNGDFLNSSLGHQFGQKKNSLIDDFIGEGCWETEFCKKNPQSGGSGKGGEFCVGEDAQSEGNKLKEMKFDHNRAGMLLFSGPVGGNYPCQYYQDHAPGNGPTGINNSS